ncbi:MAG TPA: hypothetical protein VMU77_02015, partial [Acidimicrobiales bacterium]|nr:hypothetical protein [Acidimicrobiales bacterium]
MPIRPVIQYQGSFDFDITPATLWSLIEHGEQFESWWPWLEEFSLEEGTLQPGAHLRGVVVPPLPYRMGVEIEVQRCLPEEAIDATVSGDLVGTA